MKSADNTFDKHRGCHTTVSRSIIGILEFPNSATESQLLFFV